MELKANGISCSRTRISARMKAMQLVAKAKRKFKATTDSRHDKPKVELVHDENYATREIAKTSIFNYIENYYNRKRRHSAINYMIPEQFENLELMA